MDSIDLALSNYLSTISKFNKETLKRTFPWLKLSERLLDEEIDFWLENGYIIKKDEDYYTIFFGNDDPLLFLDIDGVLNHNKSNEALDNICLKNLSYIIENTNAKIILVSSWKCGWLKDKTLQKDENANYLDKKLASFKITIFDKSSRYTCGRMFEIIDWIMKFNTNNYVILDDDYKQYENSLLMKRLVITNFYTGGLTKNLADKAIEILNGKTKNK